MPKKAKKLSKMSPVEKLVLLRQMIKEGHRQQHRAQSILSVMKLDIPTNLTQADHTILALIAKGNKRLVQG